MSYPELMQQRLFGPLGMTATHVQTARLVANGWTATGLPAQPWPMDAYAPAGAVVSTTHDLALLAVALLNGTAPGMAALTATDPTQVDHDRIGTFWHISHWMNGQNITWHAGETGGYTAYFALDREHHRAIIVLADVAASATQDVGIDLLAVPATAAPR
jgi:CubicO group peptidase (beta-lactamase class C family)